jgi:hypothetical protein
VRTTIRNLFRLAVALLVCLAVALGSSPPGKLDMKSTNSTDLARVLEECPLWTKVQDGNPTTINVRVLQKTNCQYR